VQTPAVEVTDLAKSYGPVAAVAGLTFRAERAVVTAVLGPNGAGKTTTLEICEGYRKRDSGEVRVLGRDPERAGAELRPRVGVMLQAGGVYPSARPLEMLRHVAALYAHPLEIAPLVDRLGLTAYARTPYRRLSGGMQQRLSLALALVGRPELVFLDEPTAGMDPQARHATWELIDEIRGAGVSVVLTTHLMDEAERLADHVVIVDEGRVVAEGTPAALTADAGPGGGIRFRAPACLDLGPLAEALPLDVSVAEEQPGRYLVAGAVSPQALATVTAWCASRGVMPEGLAVGRRSLEDVFLDLTGRRLR
jgi:ABC-2 type transport system ATP-binding protein